MRLADRVRRPSILRKESTMGQVDLGYCRRCYSDRQSGSRESVARHIRVGSMQVACLGQIDAVPKSRITASLDLVDCFE